MILAKRPRRYASISLRVSAITPVKQNSGLQLETLFFVDVRKRGEGGEGRGGRGEGKGEREGGGEKRGRREGEGEWRGEIEREKNEIKPKRWEREFA